MTSAQEPRGDDSPRQDRCRVALLLALAVALRVWIIPHTAVPARDGIGFMRYAWQLQHGCWTEVLRTNHHPPAYPLTILAVAAPLRHLFGNVSDDLLHLSAQLAGALAGILLVVPMYYLGRELFDRRVGFWTAVLFQCFPASGRVLSDSLSEPLFLLVCATTLLTAVRAIGRPAIWRFILCGIAVGLAYLTRPEGAILVVAVTLVLLCMAVRAADWPWRKAAACTVGLWLGTAALALPYVAVIGHLTQKPTGQKVFEVGFLDRQAVGKSVQPPPPPVLGGRGVGGEGDLRLASFAPSPPAPLPPVRWRGETIMLGAPCLHSGPLLAVWHPDDTAMGNRPLSWAIGAVLSEILKGYYYLGCLALPFGLWWFRDRFRTRPAAVVLLVVPMILFVLLVRVAMVVGYVSERHVLLLVLCGMYWVTAAMGRLGDWLSDRLRDSRHRIAAALLLLLALSGLPRTLQPLHGPQRGFREAGCWLAEHTTTSDVIIDPFGWASHYAGRTWMTVAAAPSGNRYFVWNCAKQSYRRAGVDMDQVQQWKRGQPVYHWPVQVPLEKAAVVVYCVPAGKSQW